MVSVGKPYSGSVVIFIAVNNMYNIKKLFHPIRQLNVEFLRAPF
jgi:hypothetical protein